MHEPPKVVLLKLEHKDLTATQSHLLPDNPSCHAHPVLTAILSGDTLQGRFESGVTPEPCDNRANAGKHCAATECALLSRRPSVDPLPIPHGLISSSPK